MSRLELEDILSKKPTLTPESIKQKSINKPAPLIKIDEFESANKDYKPKKVAGVFNDRYIEY